MKPPNWEKQKELLEALVEKLLSEGMPEDCGKCKMYESCEDVGEDEFCPWLKKESLLEVAKI